MAIENTTNSSTGALKAVSVITEQYVECPSCGFRHSSLYGNHVGVVIECVGCKNKIEIVGIEYI